MIFLNFSQLKIENVMQNSNNITFMSQKIVFPLQKFFIESEQTGFLTRN